MSWWCGCDEGAKSLVEALEVNSALTSVNLLKSIGIEVAKKLVAVFRRHKTLKTLCGFKPNQKEANFRLCGLRPADGMLIAADLEFNATLTHLNLSDNYLCGLDTNENGTYDSSCITALAEALRVNTALNKLDVRYNRFSRMSTFHERQLQESVKGREDLKLLLL